MGRPTDEQLSDLLRHAAETLRREVRREKVTSRGESHHVFDRKTEKVVRQPFSGPLVSELVRDLEDAAFRLERP